MQVLRFNLSTNMCYLSIQSSTNSVPKYKHKNTYIHILLWRNRVLCWNIEWQYSCYILCTGVNHLAVRDEYSNWHPRRINIPIHSHVIAEEVNCYRVKRDNCWVWIVYTQTCVTQLLGSHHSIYLLKFEFEIIF